MSSGKKSVLVTGAGSGIGFAMAKLLSENGWRVFAGVLEGEREYVVAQLGNAVEPIVLDITDAAAIAVAAEHIGAVVGDAGLHGLINNAGIVRGGPLEFIPMQEIRLQFEVNFFGHIAVTQAFLPLIRKARGRIVFTSSINGVLSPPMQGPYSASKYAIEATADALRAELRPWGIEVILVEPGAIATPIWDVSMRAHEPIVANAPPEQIKLYGDVFGKMNKLIVDRKRVSVPPVRVAQAALHGLNARRPKTRYRVSADAHIQYYLSRYTPDRLRDIILRKAMHLDE